MHNKEPQNLRTPRGTRSTVPNVSILVTPKSNSKISGSHPKVLIQKGWIGPNICIFQIHPQFWCTARFVDSLDRHSGERPVSLCSGNLFLFSDSFLLSFHFVLWYKEDTRPSLIWPALKYVNSVMLSKVFSLSHIPVVPLTIFFFLMECNLIIPIPTWTLVLGWCSVGALGPGVWRGDSFPVQALANKRLYRVKVLGLGYTLELPGEWAV